MSNTDCSYFVYALVYLHFAYKLQLSILPQGNFKLFNAKDFSVHFFLLAYCSFQCYATEYLYGFLPMQVREIVAVLDIDVLFYPCPKNGPTFRPKAIQLGGKKQFPYMVCHHSSYH